MKLVFVCLAVICSVCACKKAETVAVDSDCNLAAISIQNATKATIGNGVWGTLSLKQGNCMPMIGTAKSTCSQCPVSSELRIYALASSSDAVYMSSKSGYSSIQTQLIASAKADANGFYQLALPDGQYSMVPVYNGVLRLNSFDGNGKINPVTISAGKTKLDVVIDNAAY